MHIFTAAEIWATDARAIKQFALSGQLLMEQAGLHVAGHVFRRLSNPGKSRVVVFAGKGNNGGDGFVAARHLHRWGVKVRVYGIGQPADESSDGAWALEAARRQGVDIVPWTGTAQRRAGLHVAAADVVVDALLGIGIKGAPRKDETQAIDIMNGGRKPVVSVDIPSGVAPDTGTIAGAAVRATETITFGGLKPGLLLSPGRDFAGRVSVVDIGWPAQALKSPGHTWTHLENVRSKLPRRAPDGHKGTFGRILVVAGSRGMAGAASLCVRGAQRAGAGIVTLASPAGLNSIHATLTPEALTVALPEDEVGSLSEAAVEGMLQQLGRCDVVVAGPGLGLGVGSRRVVYRLLQKARVPVVLDADGLNAVAGRPDLLDNPNRKFPLVVTPHPGEMAHLCGTEVSAITSDPIRWARQQSARWGAVVVLKGAPTIVAEPNGHVFVNGSGSNVLASGGTGDVLAGVIAAFIGQGAVPVDAAVAGVYAHGLAGTLAGMKAEGRYAAVDPACAGQVLYGGSATGILAGDVADALPGSLALIRRGGPEPGTSHVTPRVVRIFEG